MYIVAIHNAQHYILSMKYNSLNQIFLLASHPVLQNHKHK